MTPCVTQYQAIVCVTLGWWASNVIVVLCQASAFHSVQDTSLDSFFVFKKNSLHILGVYLDSIEVEGDIDSVYKILGAPA